MTNPTNEEEDKLAAAANLIKHSQIKPSSQVVLPTEIHEAVSETPIMKIDKKELLVDSIAEVKTDSIKTDAVKMEESAKEKEEGIEKSVKEGFHRVGDFFGNISHKVVNFISTATGKIVSTPKSIEEFFVNNEDKIKNVGKWTLYVGTFKRVLDGGIYAGKKTKQQVELAYSNAMENLRQKLSLVDRKSKIENVQKEDVSFIGPDGSFFYNDKETGIATNINVNTKEGTTISEEEFEKQKALVTKK